MTLTTSIRIGIWNNVVTRSTSNTIQRVKEIPKMTYGQHKNSNIKLSIQSFIICERNVHFISYGLQIHRYTFCGSLIIDCIANLPYSFCLTRILHSYTYYHTKMKVDCPELSRTS